MMRIGGKLGERKRSEELAVEMSKSSKKNKRRQKKSVAATEVVPSTPSPVQRLFNTCKEVFADGGPGIIPSYEDIGRLQSVLDTLRPTDVGVSPRMPIFRNASSSGPPQITYFCLHDCPKFRICIFCLPPRAVIPLHDHPGMTVFSKLLFGSMHIKSYDWVEDPRGSKNRIRSSNGACLAKVVTDDVFTVPCDSSILYPEAGGNMHRFTAMTSCAVLDVLGPPYDDPERPCTYYNDYPFAQFQGGTLLPENGEKYSWLEKRGSVPDYYNVVGKPYTGPAIRKPVV